MWELQLKQILRYLLVDAILRKVIQRGAVRIREEHLAVLEDDIIEPFLAALMINPELEGIIRVRLPEGGFAFLEGRSGGLGEEISAEEAKEIFLKHGTLEAYRKEGDRWKNVGAATILKITNLSDLMQAFQNLFAGVSKEQLKDPEFAQKVGILVNRLNKLRLHGAEKGVFKTLTDALANVITQRFFSELQASDFGVTVEDEFGFLLEQFKEIWAKPFFAALGVSPETKSWQQIAEKSFQRAGKIYQRAMAAFGQRRAQAASPIVPAEPTNLQQAITSLLNANKTVIDNEIQRLQGAERLPSVDKGIETHVYNATRKFFSELGKQEIAGNEEQLANDISAAVEQWVAAVPDKVRDVVKTSIFSGILRALRIIAAVHGIESITRLKDILQQKVASAGLPISTAFRKALLRAILRALS